MQSIQKRKLFNNGMPAPAMSDSVRPAGNETGLLTNFPPNCHSATLHRFWKHNPRWSIFAVGMPVAPKSTKLTTDLRIMEGKTTSAQPRPLKYLPEVSASATSRSFSHLVLESSKVKCSWHFSGLHVDKLSHSLQPDTSHNLHMCTSGSAKTKSVLLCAQPAAFKHSNTHA